MDCVNLNSVISVLLDGGEPELNRRRLADHASRCAVCGPALNEHRRLRQMLMRARRKEPSKHLQTSLRVMASRESARRVKRLNYANRIAEWRDHVRLSFKNMMQPFALPVAGGLVSALLLFTILLPDFSVMRPIIDDVPTTFFTEASVKEMPFYVATEVVVDLHVDETGRMVDYSIVRGGSLLRDESLRRRFESALLFTQFTPATAFGQPTTGKIRVFFRNSTIEVRG